MTNNTRNAIYACLLLLAITVGACVKDSTVPESIHKLPQDFKFSEARAFFEENAKMPANYPILFDSPTTKSTVDDSLSVLSYFTILWDNVKSVEMPDSYVYEIPLLHNIPLSAVLFARTDSGFVHTTQNVKLQSNLIIRKFHKTDKIRMFISTAVGRTIVPDSLATNTSPLFWSGNKAHFEGYEFYTVLNGHPVHYAYRYKDGHRAKVFLEKYDKKEDVVKGGFMFARTHTHVNTKGAGEEGDYGRCFECRQPLDEEGGCSNCGNWLGGMPPIVGEVDRCPACGETEKMCRCAGDPTCDICGSIICVCVENGLPCPYCDLIGCRGECQNNPPDNGGSGDGESQNAVLDLIVDGLGVVTGAGTYKLGTNVKITALANQNNIFGGWSEDGILFSDLSIHTFAIQNDRCLTANFYQEGSECANLFKNYKRNTNLFATVNKHAEILNTNNQIEHAVLRTNNATYKSFTGRRDGVDIKLSLNDIYECIIHNHPSGGLIPSVEDIYTIYKADSASLLAANASFLIQTERGTLSIEIGNREKFETFALGYLVEDKSRKIFSIFFDKNILGNPNNTDLLTEETINKAIEFYILEAGLNFVFTKSNGNSADWAYIKIENSVLMKKNCLK